jgi:hypothetical protein
MAMVASSTSIVRSPRFVFGGLRPWVRSSQGDRVIYSHLKHINEAVIGLVCCMDPQPYAPRVKQGTMTIADVIEKIRFRFGDLAARSVHFTVH